MIVHLLAEKDFTKVSFWSPGNNQGTFSIPTSLISNYQPPSGKKLLGNVIKPVLELASRADVIYFSNCSQPLDSFLQSLSETRSLRVLKLPVKLCSIEWTFQSPEEIHPTRIFAMQGAVETMPLGNRILIGLLDETYIDVLQGNNHLGGIALDCFKDIRKKHFPETAKLLRPQNPKKVQPGNFFRELADQISVEGAISSWKKSIEGRFFGGAQAETITYGEDLQAIRLFRGVSDFHSDSLDFAGCEWLCKKAWSKE